MKIESEQKFGFFCSSSLTTYLISSSEAPSTCLGPRLFAYRKTKWVSAETIGCDKSGESIINNYLQRTAKVKFKRKSQLANIKHSFYTSVFLNFFHGAFHHVTYYIIYSLKSILLIAFLLLLKYMLLCVWVWWLLWVLAQCLAHIRQSKRLFEWMHEWKVNRGWLCTKKMG